MSNTTIVRDSLGRFASTKFAAKKTAPASPAKKTAPKAPAKKPAPAKKSPAKKSSK